MKNNQFGTNSIGGLEEFLLVSLLLCGKYPFLRELRVLPGESFLFLKQFWPNFHRTQNRRRRGLSQTAERCIDHCRSDIRQPFKVPCRRRAGRHVHQDLVLAFRSELARITLSATLVSEKLRCTLQNSP